MVSPEIIDLGVFRVFFLLSLLLRPCKSPLNNENRMCLAADMAIINC